MRLYAAAFWFTAVVSDAGRAGIAGVVDEVVESVDVDMDGTVEGEDVSVADTQLLVSSDIPQRYV